MVRARRVAFASGALLGLLSAAPASAQQDLGHKIPGTVGLDAGAQQPAGFYVANRLLLYGATSIVDRGGNPIPAKVSLEAITDAVGVSGTVEIKPISTFLSAAVGVPFARVTGEINRPEASLDRLGLGDIYVQPIQLGWQLSHLDLVAAYAFYLPPSRREPGDTGGVSSAQWSHELSAGSTLYLDEKKWQISARGSYQHNEPKLGIDIHRGDTVQLQGGVGFTARQVFDVGMVGYALWQVSDDTGSALPAILRGARDRVFGTGPEIDLLCAPLRSRFTLRYAHDFAVESRPVGQILLFGITFVASKPSQ